MSMPTDPSFREFEAWNYGTKVTYGTCFECQATCITLLGGYCHACRVRDYDNYRGYDSCSCRSHRR